MYLCDSETTDMKKLTKLKICDWTLLAIEITILASGLQLEITHGKSALWVWIHIALGTAMAVFVLWHLYLHFGNSGWGSKLKKKPAPRIIFIFFVLTFLLGFIAIPQYMLHGHSSIGGIHGKLGYIFIILCLVHTLRHKTFYRRR